MRIVLWLVVLTLGLPQDPVRQPEPPPAPAEPIPALPAAPGDAAPLPPIPDPPWLAVTRHDLVQRFEPPTVLEGTWRLRRVVQNGRTVDGARGYLIAGPRILMLQLLLPYSDPARGAAVQATTRGYRIRDGELEMATLLGHHTFFEGQVRREPNSLVETRRLEFAGGVVRVLRDLGDFTEFERIE